MFNNRLLSNKMLMRNKVKLTSALVISLRNVSKMEMTTCYSCSADSRKERDGERDKQTNQSEQRRGGNCG